MEDEMVFSQRKRNFAEIRRVQAALPTAHLQAHLRGITFSTDETPFFNTALVLRLLGSEANPAVTNEHGDTILHYIYLCTDSRSLQVIVQLCMHIVNVQNRLGMTPLIQACKSENMEAIKALILHGADPNIASISGQSPLTLATARMHMGMFDLLLLHGADPDGVEGANQTHPILAAVKRQHEYMIRRLLERQVNVNFIVEDTGKTMLNLGLHHHDDKIKHIFKKFVFDTEMRRLEFNGKIGIY